MIVRTTIAGNVKSQAMTMGAQDLQMRLRSTRNPWKHRTQALPRIMLTAATPSKPAAREPRLVSPCLIFVWPWPSLSLVAGPGQIVRAWRRPSAHLPFLRYRPKGAVGAISSGGSLLSKNRQTVSPCSRARCNHARRRCLSLHSERFPVHPCGSAAVASEVILAYIRAGRFSLCSHRSLLQRGRRV